MGQAVGAVVVPRIDHHGLSQLTTHFIAPEIQQREDLATRQAKLAGLVSDEIVPRLLRLHTDVVTDAPPVTALVEALAPTRADIGGLAEIVLGTNLEAAAAYVMVLRDRGLSMEGLFVELLEPTARRLGEMWDNDECDFVDVTLGVARLQQLLAVFNETHAVPALDARRRVLMAMAPGDGHRFGVAVVERFLSAAGWQVEAEMSGDADDIVAAAHRDWFAVVGFTAGSDRQLTSLTATIAEVRKRSRNPAVGIMVGGPVFTANPALAVEVGADATALNAPTAVLVAQKLFDLAAPTIV